ncbi:MAG: (2Fe-2S)-binding protein [Planctomycetes bacterium]|nr:(2Fe-2S)-binding protein [Planctomycetota bacterium]
MKYPMAITVNDERHELVVDSRRTLLHVLREDLGLTGTKEGCGEGECGACAVILDGKLVNSCLVLALEADGGAVTTIEGMARGAELHPIQKAFIERGAIQCGFCTPGMILAAKALLDENPNPSEAEIREGIAGHICRCTGYSKIVEAIQAAAQASAR